MAKAQLNELDTQLHYKNNDVEIVLSGRNRWRQRITNRRSTTAEFGVRKDAKRI
jgi:hypothetical protein